MRTFQDYLIEAYAIPFLEYVLSLDEQYQDEILSTLNEDTITILECLSEGCEFQASNAAFDELRYDLFEGSDGQRRQLRRSSYDLKKNGFRDDNSPEQARWSNKRRSSEERAKKEADRRRESGYSAKVLINPKLVQRLALDRASVNRINQYEKSQERKNQGESETRRPKSIKKANFLHNRRYGYRSEEFQLDEGSRGESPQKKLRENTTLKTRKDQHDSAARGLDKKQKRIISRDFTLNGSKTDPKSIQKLKDLHHDIRDIPGHADSKVKTKTKDYPVFRDVQARRLAGATGKFMNKRRELVKHNNDQFWRDEDAGRPARTAADRRDKSIRARAQEKREGKLRDESIRKRDTELHISRWKRKHGGG